MNFKTNVQPFLAPDKQLIWKNIFQATWGQWGRTPSMLTWGNFIISSHSSHSIIFFLFGWFTPKWWLFKQLVMLPALLALWLSVIWLFVTHTAWNWSLGGSSGFSLPDSSFFLHGFLKKNPILGYSYYANECTSSQTSESIIQKYGLSRRRSPFYTLHIILLNLTYFRGHFHSLLL